MEKVSIITVCLNSAKTIERTIKSVVGQTWRDIDYIIVDGGSSDDTVYIINKYSDRISRFISEPDDGIYFAMNKGIAMSTGEIIGIINSDDYYEEDAVEKVVNAFKKTGAEIVYGEINKFHDDGLFCRVKNQNISELWHGMPMCHPTVFVKREVYDRYGVFDTKYNIVADHELMLRFYKNNVFFYDTRELLANFRLSGMSSHKRREVMHEALILMRDYVKYAPDSDLEEKRIMEEYNSAIIDAYLMNPSDRLISELKSMFENTNSIVIFGAGYWGGWIKKLLDDCGIDISFFTDNDKDNWDKEVFGKRILAPSYLRSFSGLVIITPENAQACIKNQLLEYRNDKLKIVCLDDLRDFANRICSSQDQVET